MTRSTSFGSGIARVGLALALIGALGCATHEPRPAFRASVWIGDRGISIPLPPPSVFEAPVQDVDVEGEIMGDEPLSSAATVHIVDLQSDATAAAELPAGADAFVVEGLTVDLTDNCLELWVESADGLQSDHAFFSTTVEIVEGAETVRVRAGCADA